MKPSIETTKLISLPSHCDGRGVLTSAEGDRTIPFEIKRVFYMHGISCDRGGHAHIDTDQVIIAVHGSFVVEAFDGERTAAFPMADPTKGLYTPRLTFLTLRQFSAGAVCLVLASTLYDMRMSLRDREAYLNHLHQHGEE
jgi:hypothetical protein